MHLIRNSSKVAVAPRNMKPADSRLILSSVIGSGLTPLTSAGGQVLSISNCSVGGHTNAVAVASSGSHYPAVQQPDLNIAGASVSPTESKNDIRDEGTTITSLLHGQNDSKAIEVKVPRILKEIDDDGPKENHNLKLEEAELNNNNNNNKPVEDTVDPFGHEQIENPEIAESQPSMDDAVVVVPRNSTDPSDVITKVETLPGEGFTEPSPPPHENSNKFEEVRRSGNGPDSEFEPVSWPSVAPLLNESCKKPPTVESDRVFSNVSNHSKKERKGVSRRRTRSTRNGRRGQRVNQRFGIARQGAETAMASMTFLRSTDGCIFFKVEDNKKLGNSQLAHNNNSVKGSAKKLPRSKRNNATLVEIKSLLTDLEKTLAKKNKIRGAASASRHHSASGVVAE